MSAPDSSPWVTTSTVLQRLNDFDDHLAWGVFIERFREPIVAYARRRGLTEVDAEDAAQETLTTFAQAYRSGDYDRTRGRLSRWLFGIAHNKVEKARGHLAARRAGAVEGTQVWSQLADAQPVDPEWQEAWERTMLQQCLRTARGEFQSSTWRVFEMLVLESRSVEDAAGETGLTRNAVYVAKHRVLGRVEELLRDCDEVS